MTKRPLTSWLGLACLAGSMLLASWVRWGTTKAEAQGIRNTPLEPPLAPGMLAPTLQPPTLGNPDPRALAEPADPPTPHVTIRVRVPVLAPAGQALEYRFVVQNTAQAPAHHVRVRAPLPSNSVLVQAKPEPEPAPNGGEMIWKLNTLRGGESREIKVVVKPTGAGDLQCCARVQFEHGECVRTRLAQPDLRVRFVAPAQPLLNDHVTVQLEITNLGQRDAEGVVLTNTLPAGLDFLDSKPSTSGDNPLTWKLGTIPMGKSQRVEYQALVTRTGALVNKAEVKDNAGVKQAASVTMDVGEPKLAVAITGPKRRIVGRPATFQVTVSNPGTRPATHVELAGEVPPGITFLSASLGGQLFGSTVRWKLGTLAPGAKETVTIILQARKDGDLIYRPQATADRALAARAESTTRFAGGTGLSLDIDKAPDPLEVGQAGTFTLRVANQGTADAEHVIVTLTMPEELKVSSAPPQAVRDGAKLTFKMDKLTAGVETKFVIKAEAVRAADARLRAELTADKLSSGPIHFEESILLHRDMPSPPPAPRPLGQ